MHREPVGYAKEDIFRSRDNGTFDRVPLGECSAVERDVPEVVKALNSLHSATERYENLVVRLQDRLRPVVQPPRPDCAGQPKDKMYGTDLANTIHELGMKVHNITSALEDLYERIEL